MISIQCQTDKVSLLEGTIDYLKTLEQKVENLEEARRRGRENKASSVLVADKNDRNNPEELLANSEALPKVEASLEGNTILIRIQCEKRKGALVRVLSEIDELCLSVINTNVVQFGTSHNMTITTEASSLVITLLPVLAQSRISILLQFYFSAK
jgi:hypothetical protein